MDNVCAFIRPGEVVLAWTDREDDPQYPLSLACLRYLESQTDARGRTICAICHGVCGLLNVRLSDGSFLITDKKLTGFSWFEEILVGRSRVVPFNLEAALKERGADYTKALVPPIPKVVVDGKLITGQDPFSSGKMAETVMRELEQ